MITGKTSLIAYLGNPTEAFKVGTDMLFEQIPAYLEFFGFGTATADELRAVVKVS